MEYVRRINLKTDCANRKALVEYCLMNEQNQFVAIGWSYVYSDTNKLYKDYNAFYKAVEKDIKKRKGRINHALNSFWYVQKDDLFWTRDLDGFYWICRAKDVAIPKCDTDMDIGAVVPVEAYRFGLEVPGRIKASFNRANGGVIEDIRDDLIINYSKYIYNELSSKEYYKDVKKTEGNIIDNLPDFDLEELIISYLQVKENYYVLSNSIANKSTTVGIECELISRDKNNPVKAVVQVKAKEDYITYEDYKGYIDNGYVVYFYDGGREKDPEDKTPYKYISRKVVEEFYAEYRNILPDSLTKWEKLFV